MENIYQKYRRMSGITQEKAAEHLNISVDSLKGYEYGKRIPSNEVVSKMCLVYSDMKLAYDHLVNSSVVEVLAPLDDKDLCCAVVGFLNELNKSDLNKSLILEIASDGVISDNERPDWERVEHQLRQLIKSIFEVIYRR